MDAPPPSSISPQMEAASALRSMVIGALGLLLGAAFVLCAAFDLATGARERFGSETVAMLLAALIAVLGGFSLVRGLAVRGTDALSAALMALVVVPLGVLAFAGYRHTHPPDRQLEDESVPYTFTYPGKWEKKMIDEVPPRWNAEVGGVAFVSAVGDRDQSFTDQGVVVVAFDPKSREALVDWVRNPGPSGAQVVNERTVEIAGRRAFGVDYEFSAGRPFQSQFALMGARRS